MCTAKIEINTWIGTENLWCDRQRFCLKREWLAIILYILDFCRENSSHFHRDVHLHHKSDFYVLRHKEFGDGRYYISNEHKIMIHKVGSVKYTRFGFHCYCSCLSFDLICPILSKGMITFIENTSEMSSTNWRPFCPGVGWEGGMRRMMTSSNGNIFRITGHLCGTGEFPAQRPVTRSFDVFFDLRLN